MIEVVVYPSLLNKLGFCPRALYFELFRPKKPRPSVRLKMMIGRLTHFLRRILKIGHEKEKLLTSYYRDHFLIVGRPDNYRDHGDYVLLEEFKTKVAQKPFLGDILQVMAYIHLLESNFKKRVEAYLVYLNGRFKVEFDEKLFNEYLDLYYDIYLGEMPDRGRDRCGRCQYTDYCRSITSK